VWNAGAGEGAVTAGGQDMPSGGVEEA
jgi:hypothetical protein